MKQNEQVKIVWEITKTYTACVCGIFVLIFVLEESFIKDSKLRNFALDLVNHKKANLFSYLSQTPTAQSLPTNISLCDWETMQPRDFLIDYIQQSKPCLLKGYAKSHRAYELWQNTTYLLEQAGEDIIYPERAPLHSKEFAYFKKTFKKEYMTYAGFIEAMSDPEREFNYYFAQESIPMALRGDVKQPDFAKEYLAPSEVAYWHGIGTVSLPHTDADENFMCVYKGYKNFSIVSPFQTKY